MTWPEAIVTCVGIVVGGAVLAVLFWVAGQAGDAPRRILDFDHDRWTYRYQGPATDKPRWTETRHPVTDPVGKPMRPPKREGCE